jgi:hypothetical protein
LSKLLLIRSERAQNYGTVKSHTTTKAKHKKQLQKIRDDFAVLVRRPREKAATIANENLPARFPWLPRGFAIIFIGKAISPAPAAFTRTSAIAAAPAVSSATTTTARTPAPAAALASKASAATRTRSTRRSAFTLRPRFIYFQIASAGFLAIQTSDRLGRFRIVRHFHESESARPARFAIHGHMHARYLTERLKQRTKIALRRLKIHVPNKKTFHVASPGILLRRRRENQHSPVVERAASNRLKSKQGGSQSGRRGIQAIQCRKSDNITLKQISLGPDLSSIKASFLVSKGSLRTLALLGRTEPPRNPREGISGTDCAKNLAFSCCQPVPLTPTAFHSWGLRKSKCPVFNEYKWNADCIY